VDTFNSFMAAFAFAIAFGLAWGAVGSLLLIFGVLKLVLRVPGRIFGHVAMVFGVLGLIAMPKFLPAHLAVVLVGSLNWLAAKRARDTREAIERAEPSIEPPRDGDTPWGG